MHKIFAPVLFLFLCLAGCSGSDTAHDTTSIDSTNVAAMANCNDAAAMEKIRKAISIQTIAELNDEQVAIYEKLRSKPEWTEEDREIRMEKEVYLTDYRVDTLFYENCLLSVRAVMQWSAAYPDSRNVFLNFDKRTGDSLLIGTLIDNAKIAGLVAACDARLQKNIVQNRNDRKSDPEEVQALNDMLGEELPKFTAENLGNYFIDKDGVVFVYEFSFPHAFRALEPDGNIRFSKADFKPYIRKDGPLAISFQ